MSKPDIADLAPIPDMPGQLRLFVFEGTVEQLRAVMAESRKPPIARWKHEELRPQRRAAK
jgi:hypothetical protein